MRRLLSVSVLVVSLVSLAACKVDDTGGAQQQPQGQAQPQGGQTGGAQQANPQAGGPNNGGPAAFPTIDPTAAAAFQDVNRLAVGMLSLQDAGTHPLTKDQAAKLLPLWQDVQSAMRPPANPQGGPGQNGTPQPPQDQTPGAPGQGQGQGGGRGGNGGGPNGFRRGGFFGDPAKIEADVAGIRAVLTQVQISDINALTQDDMTATLQKHSLNFGFGAGGQGGGRNGGFPGGFQGTPGAFATARAEGTLPSRPTPDANQLATIQARPTLSPDDLATAQARRAQGNPLYAAVVTLLQGLAGN